MLDKADHVLTDGRVDVPQKHEELRSTVNRIEYFRLYTGLRQVFDIPHTQIVAQVHVFPHIYCLSIAFHNHRSSRSTFSLRGVLFFGVRNIVREQAFGRPVSHLRKAD